MPSKVGMFTLALVNPFYSRQDELFEGLQRFRGVEERVTEEVDVSKSLREGGGEINTLVS